MKISKLFAALFGVVGICAAAFGIFVSFQYMNASRPTLLEEPEAARENVVELFDAVCEKDFDTVSDLLYGNPVFGIDREPTDAVGVLIWNAFIDSVAYELGSELYATESGVAQNVTITALDMDSVTAVLKERSTALLEQRVKEAEDTSEIYDENNNYREDFVMQVLYDAAAQALKSDGRQITQDVTINMIYENGKWWIMPDSQLLTAISGGILK